MTAQVTVVIPSFNQGNFLEDAIKSVLAQRVNCELIIMDGGSSDESLQVIKKYEPYLHYWQSEPDGGQANAINLGVAKGKAPYVCWLNSDDFFYPDMLSGLVSEAEKYPGASFVYGRAWNVSQNKKKRNPYLSFAFNYTLLRNYCFICQPATLIPRQHWQTANGVDSKLNLAFDYDLWFRLYRLFGKPRYVREFIAANRMHQYTKTNNNLDAHYAESVAVVKQHTGSAPIKWFLMKPVMRCIRLLARFFRYFLQSNTVN
ncbi:MAG TPA: glycosyltransferase family 2 protein [Rheinheimera sp.]|uniref:glycosyltransferase family 2 protein n=1 Tax=Rheinheimera sp. TaxID=1869214 RepID=UPI002F93DBB2